MNALDHNRFTGAWQSFGADVENPRAILVISAHWYINASAVTAMPQPRTIHDFYGFPDELFAVQYPAPGDPQLAEEIAEVVKPTWVGLDADSWGIDHGSWSVLRHAFPDATIPVLQLSINALKPMDYHFKLGARLAALRERGVLIIGSGNVVHNLGLIDWAQPEAGYDWARRFDDAAAELMTLAPDELLRLEGHEDFTLAAPTPDHFIPLVYLAGLAYAADQAAHVLVDGYAMGSLSMASYTLGCDELEPAGQGGSPVLPRVPADETNL
jgi:4,5-DOPA dioxygenase extradiol